MKSLDVFEVYGSSFEGCLSSKKLIANFISVRLSDSNIMRPNVNWSVGFRIF